MYERTRELGLLRAVGDPGQVRQMVRWESVVISLIGASAGAVLGTGLGIMLAQALKDEGIEAISVPGPRSPSTSPRLRSPVCRCGRPGQFRRRVDVLKAVVTD